MDNQSIAHTRWNCTYHIVIIPKYPRKIMYGEVKKDIGEILRKLCDMSEAKLIKGTVCSDHVHLYIAIPPKSALMLFDRHLEFRRKNNGRNFWARGYYVVTDGNVNESTIVSYIREQEENNKLEK